MAVFVKNDITSTGADTLKLQLDMLAVLEANMLNGEHNGLITYHFARPDPNDPYRVQYIEVYGSPESFVNHLTPEAMDLLTTNLAPANLTRFDKNIFGTNLDNNQDVLDILKPFGVDKMPNIAKGYILHPNAIFKDSLSDQKPTMVDFIMKTKHREDVKSQIDELVKMAKADILTMAATEHDDIIELTEICGSNSALVNHLGAPEAKSIIGKMESLCESVYVNVYGETHEGTKEMLKDFGFETNYINTDAGFILNPNPDSNGK
ncbi:unnamed protein product [Owenia fusiformis]|uniref:Uncharacterized protein n=1 Tax=Owenia fusiformis TaxID=6347 RepID=A0A8J1U783_OWEFU|nr:unnamed protein product [Owenia fusiformis]